MSSLMAFLKFHLSLTYTQSVPSFHFFNSDLYSRELLDEYLSRALGVELENGRLTLIDDSDYVLTMDYTIKMLNIHERSVPVYTCTLYVERSPLLANILYSNIICSQN